MQRPIDVRREAGGVLPVLLVLVLLVGAGGANYWRNLQAEPPRPYAQYDDQELMALVEAYELDVEQRGDRLPPARREALARDRAGLQERVADFEAAQRDGRRSREASSQLAGQEGVLRELRVELDYRAGGEWGIHLRRLTTL